MEPVVDTQVRTADEIKTTTCYMCACRCGIRVHLKDGEVRYIDGNRDHPVNRGVICGKGAAGIMQQLSPARLRAPMLRVGERGENRFEEITWDAALALATQWLGEVRERDPKKLAFFTGRDQSQSLTGFWAMKYGTPNFAAHGGFCSVNMAAAGLYTFGGSFWEFGEPDWDNTEYFLMFGVAEDHASNPIKIALGKLKARGVKIVAVNPIRTGYAAIADEWLGIRPGTDGMLVGALIHELLSTQKIDVDSLRRHTNAGWLVIDDPGAADDGMFVRDADGRPVVDSRWSRSGAAAGPARGRPDDVPNDLHSLNEDGRPQAAPTFAKSHRKSVAVFDLLARRYLADDYAPAAAERETGIPASTIRRLAAELAEAAFTKEIRVETPWTDWTGERHDAFIGRPVAMHAMRGISAHANGFHTCRMIHLLQILLGSIDCPGGFRYKPPYPKPAPPQVKPFGRREHVHPREPLAGPHLGFPTGPDDLLIDDDGRPTRIDKAFSWDAPLAAHGLMHAVITNAANGDPYPIDVLFMYMANMAWNSTMATPAVIGHLTAKDPATGAYKIPKIIYSDAFSSEMVAYADLILPDTTYLERWDCISLLDRPISDPDSAADAIRQPVVRPDRDVRSFQEVLIDLGGRLQLPGFVDQAGRPKYPGGYADYIVNHERAPGIGPLSGWRGKDGESFGRGAVNPGQLDRYIANGCFHIHHLAPSQRYMKHVNRDYLEWALSKGYIGSADPVIFQLYLEPIQAFRLAARGHGPLQPPDSERSRIERYFDPLPFWYPPEEVGDVDESSTFPLPAGEGGRRPIEGDSPSNALPRGAPSSALRAPSPQRGEGNTAAADFPLHAITQRPMHMYHSWGSQNAWLRQITNENRLYVARQLAARQQLVDDDWVALTSPQGRITCQVKLMDGVNPDTVWTWNAVGKRRGAWGLDAEAPEGTRGFLLNHLIADLLPARPDGYRYSNSDPVTGQAAWYDLKVRMEKIDPPADGRVEPQFELIGGG